MRLKKGAKKSKVIGSYSFKGESSDGNLSKHVFTVLDNGIIDINQIILSKDKELVGFKAITKRFGKTLHVNAIGFKFTTLQEIYDKALLTLIQNEIHPDNIL